MEDYWEIIIATYSSRVSLFKMVGSIRGGGKKATKSQ